MNTNELRSSVRRAIGASLLIEPGRDLEQATDEVLTVISKFYTRTPAVATGEGTLSYADWQQRRGMLADKVDWAIHEYEEFMKDDNYDVYGALDRIINGLRETRDTLKEGSASPTLSDNELSGGGFIHRAPTSVDPDLEGPRESPLTELQRLGQEFDAADGQVGELIERLQKKAAYTDQHFCNSSLGQLYREAATTLQRLTDELDSEAMVERVTIAIFRADDNRAGAWQARSDQVRENYRAMARAALNSIRKALNHD